MSRGPAPGVAMPRRVFLIGAAVAAMAVGVVLLGSGAERSASDPAHPTAAPVAATPVAATPEAVASEAEVFRMRPGDLAAGAGAARRSGAHPRTLATFRVLRAYPGAPPRIPHGLTPEEVRTTRCNTCHERGGYSARFAAYVPVTPHPELADCLQCHVGDAAVVGTALPGADPDAVCRQCHAPGATTPPLVPLDWRSAPWPEPDDGALGGLPPPIPHDLHLRGNCLACHAGPAAVEEIRTTHAERADCRQCHVAAGPDVEVFARPPHEPDRRGGRR